MVALYDSYIYPFVALFAIPVAAIGAFLALNLSLSHLSLFALLGLIMLMGLVTKNSILIVDFTNQLKAEGKIVSSSHHWSKQRQNATYFNDDFINGNRNVADSISHWNIKWMEKRIGWVLSEVYFLHWYWLYFSTNGVLRSR